LLEDSEKRCSFHPDVDAVDHCTRCGRAVCIVCAIEVDDECMCEPCSQNVDAPPSLERDRMRVRETRQKAAVKTPTPRTESISQAMAAQPYVAWEYRREIGRFYALSLTWQRSLFSPLRFFRGVPLVGGYRSPLLYGMLWSLAGFAGAIAWKLLFYTYPKIVLLFQGHPVDITLQLSRNYGYVATAVLLLPFLGMLLLLAASVLYHLFIVVLTRQHAGFEATLRVVCYGTGTNIFFFLPILGGIIGALWQLVLVFVGLKEVHRFSYPTTLVVMLVPYAILLAGGIAFMLWSVTEGFLNLNTASVERIISLLS